MAPPPVAAVAHDRILGALGARARGSLDDAEASLSFARLVQPWIAFPKPTGDLTELRAIHRHLFQDLDDWAGQIRIVDIRKNVEGAEFCCRQA